MGSVPIETVNTVVNFATALSVAYASYQLRRLRKGVEDELDPPRRRR